MGWVDRCGAGGVEGHIGSVRLVAFSSDGTQIVSGSSDNSVWVWDASTGVLSDFMIGYEHFAWHLANSNWIISSQGLIWVPHTAGLCMPFHIHHHFSIDFHQCMMGVDWVHSYTP